MSIDINDSHLYYSSQRQHAKARGIPFSLTFEEWVEIWDNSGKWHLRGKKKGQYVMARNEDKGGYEKGNVSIIPATINIQLQRAARPAPTLGKNWKRLAKEQVIEIRNSSETQGDLAKKYKVAKSTIWSIQNKKVWKNIESSSSEPIQKIIRPIRKIKDESMTRKEQVIKDLDKIREAIINIKDETFIIPLQISILSLLNQIINSKVN
jgi:hypothetical protein